MKVSAQAQKLARVHREAVKAALERGLEVRAPNGRVVHYDPRGTNDTYPLVDSRGVRLKFTGCTWTDVPEEKPKDSARWEPDRPYNRTFSIPPRVGRTWDYEAIDTVLLHDLVFEGVEWVPVSATVNNVGALEIFCVSRKEEM